MAAETAAVDPVADPDEVIPPESEHVIQLDDPAPMDHDYTAAPEGTNAEDVLEPASPVRANPPQNSPAPASPARTATPSQPVAASSPDIQITGTGFTAPAEPIVLAKHTAKAEKLQQEKGKWSTDLSNYAELSAQELYSGYLNRLHTSRDYELVLVNMMKDKYEVSYLSLLCLLYTSVFMP